MFLHTVVKSRGVKLSKVKRQGTGNKNALAEDSDYRQVEELQATLKKQMLQDKNEVARIP